jgi:5'(3')-deoxyribonucleotidase
VTKSLRIVVDVDEVLADTATREIAWLNQRFGHSLTLALVSRSKLEELVPKAHAEALEAHLHEGEFFADLPVMRDSQSVLRQLAERYDVFVATAAMEYPRSLGAKFTWLAKHFPFISPQRLVFCGDKSILAADVLIDDNERNLRVFRGQGYLFTAPHNARVEGYARLANWQEVRRQFLDESATVLGSDD